MHSFSTKPCSECGDLDGCHQRVVDHIDYVLSDPKREHWYLQQAGAFYTKFLNKVKVGRAEHGTDLGSVPTSTLFLEARAELLDAWCYLSEIERRSVMMMERISSLEAAIAAQTAKLATISQIREAQDGQ